MNRSLATALALAYVRTTLVVVLVLALGVAVTQIVAFSQRSKIVVAAARDEARMEYGNPWSSSAGGPSFGPSS